MSKLLVALEEHAASSSNLGLSLRSGKHPGSVLLSLVAALEVARPSSSNPGFSRRIRLVPCHSHQTRDKKLHKHWNP